jgi:hypothetical protein
MLLILAYFDDADLVFELKYEIWRREVPEIHAHTYSYKPRKP